MDGHSQYMAYIFSNSDVFSGILFYVCKTLTSTAKRNVYPTMKTTDRSRLEYALRQRYISQYARENNISYREAQLRQRSFLPTYAPFEEALAHLHGGAGPSGCFERASDRLNRQRGINSPLATSTPTRPGTSAAFDDDWDFDTSLLEDIDNQQHPGYSDSTLVPQQPQEGMHTVDNPAGQTSGGGGSGGGGQVIGGPSVMGQSASLQILHNPTELGSALAQIRARVKANRGSGQKKDEEADSAGGSSRDSQRTANTKKILEEDRARFSKLRESRERLKEEFEQILIEREEQKKVEKQLHQTIAKVTAPTPELSPLIKQRIIDLETNVENLKERLAEKDAVLASKSQALSVLQKQVMQLSSEQVSKARQFSAEISTLREEFTQRETHLKGEIARLKAVEEQLELKLSESELESRRLLDEASQKLAETSSTLETTNKINLKLKAQLKALKTERDQLKESELKTPPPEVEELKERIALLEEEKGNLQLQLVDFDDVKDLHMKLKSRVPELENELISLKESCEVLKRDKSSLQADLDSAQSTIQEQDNLIQNLQSSLKEVTEQKISAEMRAIDLEERFETFQTNSSSQIDQFKLEIQSLLGQIEDKNSIIDSLSNQLSLKEQEIFDIKGNNFSAEVETDSRLREIESYNSELVEKVRELELKSDGHERVVLQLNETLSEKNETINILKTKCDELNAVIVDLNNNKSVLEKEILTLREGSSQTDGKEDVNLKFKKLAANYKMKVKLCHELEDKLKLAEAALEEKSSEAQVLFSQINDLKSELEEVKNTEKCLKDELESVKVKNEQYLKVIEDMVPKLEAMETEKSVALQKAEQMKKTLDELKEWKEGDSKILKDHVTSVNSMVSNVSLLEQELVNLQAILNEKNNVIGELESERKNLVEDMKRSEEELERLRSLYEAESSRNLSVLSNLQGLESEMLTSREEMGQIAEQLNSVTSSYNLCLGNLQERENYIEALEQDIVDMKTKMYNIVSGIGDRHRVLEERGNQLSARLEEAEILSQNFEKYETEMEKKLKTLEENEKSMKENVQKLEIELKSLKKTNEELLLKNKSSEKSISEMSDEINTLKDVKNSYNTTLDHIELLNGELKQVMCDFEAKNLELIRLSEERAELSNKLTDCEDAYADLKSLLDESQRNTDKLQSELGVKSNALENSLLEINSLRNEIEVLKSKNSTSGRTEFVSPSEVEVFSWDQHSQPGETSIGQYFTDSSEKTLSSETELIKKLEQTQKEVELIRSQMNSIILEKDNEISGLKNELSKLLNDYNNLKIQSTISVEEDKDVAKLSCDPLNASDLPSSSSFYNVLKEEVEENRVKLESAQKEITHLKNSLDSVVSNYETKLSELKEEFEKISNEKNDLEKFISLKDTEVKLFSWGNNEESFKNEESDDVKSLKVELEEKNKLLELALIDLKNLQRQFDEMLHDKDSQINLLKDEVSKFLAEKESIGAGVDAEPWGSGSGAAESGWGWASQEAHLEQKHSETLQINQLLSQVKLLEQERETLNEKLNASKIKCMKLIKKYKELEVLNEQAKNDRSVGFSDLDFALQEEMRSQLDQLETQNKELNNELKNLKLEKENLLKRIDVLVSAQEQMLDMKERQDIEVQMWQKRSAELKNEVEALKWSVEELKSERLPASAGDGELIDKCNALALENENLQEIICNLRDGRPLGSPDLTAQLSLLKEEVDKLTSLRIKEKETFEAELKKANEHLDSMEQNLEELSAENVSLKSKNEAKLNESATSLNELVQSLTENNKKYQDEISELKSKVSQFDYMNIELNNLKQKIEALNMENGELKATIESSNQNVPTLLGEIEELSKENDNLKVISQPNSQFDILKEKYDVVCAELNSLREEFDKMKHLNQHLEEDLSVTKEANNYEIKKLLENIELAESNYKNVESNLKSITEELKEFDELIEGICVKFGISLSSSSNVIKLKEISVFVDKILNENLKLSEEIASLKNKISEPSSASMPPVFKGFSSSQDDPFDALQTSQSHEIEVIRSENDRLKNVVSNYERNISQLESEKLNYEEVIDDLKGELTAMNDHIGKLNLQRGNMMDDVGRKLAAADSEITRWRDEASQLKREMNRLIEKHAQDIEELRRNESGSKEKLSEIEENYQNTMLNKDQESGYLKEILSDKEQLLANAINEKNALHVQFDNISQQVSVLENRVRELTLENQELRSHLEKSRQEENFIIGKQKEEIMELNSKLQYLSQSQNLKSTSDHEVQLKNQIKELSEKLSFIQQSNNDLTNKISAQSDEITRLQFVTTDLENKKIFLENVLSEKQKEIESKSLELSQTQLINVAPSEGTDKLMALIKEKDLEIARVSKVLLDTQERLVQVQESKPLDRVMSLESRLDRALYTIHVRDVRIDELNQEIMQLLEERDSLQLRLSEALRESELLRRRPASEPTTSQSPTSPPPHFKERMTELREGYKKDPALQLDMESRHSQQMGLYSTQDEKDGETNSSTVDYGIFNWFFSSPSPKEES